MFGYEKQITEIKLDIKNLQLRVKTLEARTTKLQARKPKHKSSLSEAAGAAIDYVLRDKDKTDGKD